MRILIIDDDEIFAHTLVRSFKRRQIDSVVALDLRNALAAATKSDFDAVVLDLRLGKESGLGILEALRNAQPKARILMLTGYSSIATAVDAIKLGADNYLPKPAGAEEILKALQSSATDSTMDIPEQAPSLDRLEWEHIQRVLMSNDGNISASARELGMHRRTLQRKLAKKPVRK
jgi:two-component system response regulator RegA